MSELHPINLDTVLAELQKVVDSIMMLGGQILDFADPLKNMPDNWRQSVRESEARHRETLDRYTAENGQCDDDPVYQSLKEGRYWSTPTGIMHSYCDQAWDDLQVSLRRLCVMLENGDVELLDCDPWIIPSLKRIWDLLEVVNTSTKPEYTPGKPNKHWALEALMGRGRFLQLNADELKSMILHQSEKHTDNDDINSWSFPATLKKWATRFGVTERTLQNWRKKNNFRMKQAGKPGEWQVHTEESAYVTWNSNRTSIKE